MTRYVTLVGEIGGGGDGLLCKNINRWEGDVLQEMGWGREIELIWPRIETIVGVL
jgi:hypothetical protein